MSYCPQCGADCANAVYCPQCGSAVGSRVSAASNEPNSNPFAVGAQVSEYSGRNYDPNAPEIPGFGGAIAICFKKYCCFKGRASRSEYWYWTLFLGLVNVVLQILKYVSILKYDSPEAAIFLILMEVLWDFVTFLPHLAVCVRRLHDIDYSGWRCLIGILPIIGWIILLVWLVRRGVEGENRFGLEPQKRK